MKINDFNHNSMKTRNVYYYQNKLITLMCIRFSKKNCEQSIFIQNKLIKFYFQNTYTHTHIYIFTHNIYTTQHFCFKWNDNLSLDET